MKLLKVRAVVANIIADSKQLSRLKSQQTLQLNSNITILLKPYLLHI